MRIHNIISAIRIDYTNDSEEALLDFKRYFHLDTIKTTHLKLGETNTVKYVIDSGYKRYFLKCGEKVDVEIEAYEKPQFQSMLFFRMLYHTKNALIIPFFESRQLAEILYNPNGVYIQNILRGILNTTAANLWLKYTRRTSTDIFSPKEYIVKRQVPPQTMFDINGTALTVDELYSQPIQYIKNGQICQLPAIKKMIETVLELCKEFPQLTETCVLGDYQPTNILVQKNQFKIVDISNANVNGDIAMDLGKFFNFVDRFYIVSRLRDHNYTTAKAAMTLNSKGVTISLDNEVNKYITNLNLDLEERFVRSVIEQTGDYTLSERVKLYKVITSYITINRHLKHENLGEHLFACLADAYTELERAVIKI